jgi:hypothetical protein
MTVPETTPQKTHAHLPNLWIITYEVNGGKGTAIQTALAHITGDHSGC